MNNKSILALSVIALAFMAYLYFYGESLPGTFDAEKSSQRLVRLDSEEIQRVELTNPSGSFVFVQDDGKENLWSLESPISYPADKGILIDLIKKFEKEQRKATISEDSFGNWEEALSTLGLKEPRYRITFYSKDEAYQVDFGKYTATQAGIYVLVVQNKTREFAVINRTVEGYLNKNLTRWRSHNIFRLGNDKVSDLLLRKQEQEVQISQKGENEWVITKPLTTRADTQEMKQYLINLLNSKVQGYASDKEADLALFGLNTPSLVLEIGIEGREEKTVLKIGNESEDFKELYFAQLEGRPTVFMVSKAFFQKVSDLFVTVRAQRIFQISKAGQIELLSLNTPHYELDLLRDDTARYLTWRLPQLANRNANTKKIQDFVEHLKSIKAISFYPDSKEARIKYGLQNPLYRIRYRVSPSQSEEDQEEKEKKEEGSLEYEVIIGKTEEGQIYAKSPFLEFIGEISEESLKPFPTYAYEWIRNKLSLVRKAKDVQELRWKKGEEVLFSLKKNAQQEWPSEVEGKQVNTFLRKHQFQLLRQLTLEKWVPYEDVAKSMEQGGEVFQLEIVLPDRSKVIEFGAMKDQDLYWGHIEEDDFAFVLKKSDFETLETLPLVGIKMESQQSQSE